ncbi:unnamed protein product [Didymodactylos carnosus]|uniref:Uncharacterized protein n=1 Tax=Didymodactylos carnosus TaxID=1234261 RepID=A0A815DAJ6_9BILA|nr:unnamed protein product [Didymodactylos carnosus]CAF4116761.1 unnamed protein product [Didymodactylos carnosus]
MLKLYSHRLLIELTYWSDKDTTNMQWGTTKEAFILEGGEDFDQNAVEHFIQLFKTRTGLNVRNSNRAVQKLRREVEKSKRILSAQVETRIEIESFFNDKGFSEIFTRPKFESLNVDLFRSTITLTGPKWEVR